MKKFLMLSVLAAIFVLVGCSPNDIAQMNYEREAKAAKYQSEYATSINKLEMKEGDFKTYRRVTFYNVRLGEVVFVCEGYCHVQIDKDRDVEIVVKVGDTDYLRHYLGQRTDITYFSEQLKPTTGVDGYRYEVIWNPKVWVPKVVTK